MHGDVCFCNVKSRKACCVIDCRNVDDGPGCYRCHCSKNEERCIMTGQTKHEREEGIGDERT